MEAIMGQAIPHLRAAFPLAGILQRIKGLAEYPVTEGGEPFLEDVMHDPIVQQLMQADHLQESDVRRAITRAQPHLLHH